jgi:hypothetical protein
MSPQAGCAALAAATAADVVGAGQQHLARHGAGGRVVDRLAAGAAAACGLAADPVADVGGGGGGCKASGAPMAVSCVWSRRGPQSTQERRPRDDNGRHDADPARRPVAPDGRRRPRISCSSCWTPCPRRWSRWTSARSTATCAACCCSRRPVPLAQWLPGVTDLDGRALPAGYDPTPLHALVQRRHAEIDRAIGRRDWFDPWIFQLDDDAAPSDCGAALGGRLRRRAGPLPGADGGGRPGAGRAAGAAVPALRAR